MMYPAGGIKPGCVHIPAFTADGSAIRFATHTGVIARLDRATQYAAASVIEPKSRGVLDPRLRGDDEFAAAARAARHHAFFFTSLTLEKTMPSARSLV